MSRLTKLSILAAALGISFSGLYAQNTAVGYSMPGSIGKQKAPEKPPENIIHCGIRLFDESGDGVLSEGENASLIILMENTSDSLTVHPRVDIFFYNRENSYPVYTILFTDSIDPQSSLAVQNEVIWHGTLPTGDLPYNVKITDLNGRAKPLTLDFVLEALGSGSLPLEKPHLIQ